MLDVVRPEWGQFSMSEWISPSVTDAEREHLEALFEDDFHAEYRAVAPQVSSAMVIAALSATKRFPAAVVDSLSAEYPITYISSYAECIVLGIVSCADGENIAEVVKAEKRFARFMAVLTPEDGIVFADVDRAVREKLAGAEECMADYNN